MTSSVIFDGFPLTGQTPGGGVASLVGRDGLDGWFNRSMRRSRDDKSQQDGAWPSLGYASALPLTMSGQVVYPDAASAAAERRVLASLGGPGSTALTVTDPLGTGTRMVETDAMRVSPVNARIVEFSIAVTATDPLLYGPEVYATASLASAGGGTGLVYPLAYPLDYGVPPGTTPGAVSVGNIGTASYVPRLRITGPVTNPVVGLVETGDLVRVNRYVEAGQHVDINWGTPRRVTIGDNPVSIRHQVSSSGNFLAVPVGGGQITFAADDADPAASLSVWSYEGAWQ